MAGAPERSTLDPEAPVIRVREPLPLDLIGILTSIADPLARAGVSIFAISIYNRDYVLVSGKELDVAIGALKHAGHEVTP